MGFYATFVYIEAEPDMYKYYMPYVSSGKCIQAQLLGCHLIVHYIFHSTESLKE